MKHKVLFFVLAAAGMPASDARAQGCSDAGFCTAGTLQPAAFPDSSYRYRVGMSLGYGAGEQGTGRTEAVAEWEWRYRSAGLQVKIPYVWTSGDLGALSGWGDLTATVTLSRPAGTDREWSATAGVKLPVGTTDGGGTAGRSLPMPYQTGLGTTDLILGGAVTWHAWKASIGFQVILQDRNLNTFSHAGSFVYEPESDYFESNGLRRGNDALFRLERNLVRDSRWTATPGVLLIYRLREDRVADPAGNLHDVAGSGGLTLNLTGSASLAAGSRFRFLLTGGTPLIVRESRPDGLTRSFVVSGGVQYTL